MDWIGCGHSKGYEECCKRLHLGLGGEPRPLGNFCALSLQRCEVHHMLAMDRIINYGKYYYQLLPESVFLYAYM